MKIKTVGPVSEFKTSYGQMKKYSVQFEGSEDWVTINQKPESPAPAVGQELEGAIEDTQYGKTFKKAQGAFGSGQKGVSNDPATRASIEAQTSLNAAVTAVNNFYSDELPADLKLGEYVNKIVQVSKVFSASLAGKPIDSVAKVAEVMPGAEEVSGKAPADINGEVNLDEIPF